MRHEAATGVSPAQAQANLEELVSQENIPLGAVYGAVAAVVGAGIWALITVVTEYQIGWMAIGVGCLVGFAVQFGGKGVTATADMVGAALALFGCLLGNLLTMTYFIAESEGVPFVGLLGELDPALIVEIMTATFEPMDLLFYGFAIYCGFKYASRPA